ncbi:MAG: phospholipase [Parvibaculaceae bacterium]
MTDATDTLTDAITALVPPLLHALEGLAFISRHLHPPQFAQIVDHVGDLDRGVAEGLAVFEAAPWPDHLAGFRDRLVAAAVSTQRAYEELRAARDDPNGIIAAYRALRHSSRAMEALYPIAQMLPPVSRFFLDEDQRDDKALIESLAAEGNAAHATGIHHFGNEKGTRGGFSLYVPENYDPARSYPVVFALHGGSGHGRDFLWSWIKTARGRGAILVSPTAAGDTWALMGPDEDGPNLMRILDHVAANWSIDREKLLLTGMSDGGTFTYVQGLTTDSPFTHLAPISGSFHPFLMEVAESERVSGLPVYLTHGAKDWMFPPDIARTAYRALAGAGADIVYREIGDLSHIYPREENARIMDWFLDGTRPPEASA